MPSARRCWPRPRRSRPRRRPSATSGNGGWPASVPAISTLMRWTRGRAPCSIWPIPLTSSCRTDRRISCSDGLALGGQSADIGRMTAPPSNQGRRRGMKNQDWEIPPNLQPDPDDYSFDLERALRAIVNLKTYVPPDAYTAGTLGTERAGSGVVIRESGLVATIGYLITEAETIWITSSDGRAIPGHALAYDQETGFGLVQALGQLNLPALEMG